MRRFPLRTLLLMVIALLAFVRLWIITHDRDAPDTRRSPVSQESGKGSGR